MLNKKVSIIVPVYNVEKFIHKCVNSLRNQTYKNIEIILVEDGSPDKSGEICDVFAKEDNRIKVIHKENGGVSSARNLGLKVAKGDYVCFVDSDDWVSEVFVEKLIDGIKNSDLVVSDFYKITENNEEYQSIGFSNEEFSLDSNDKKDLNNIWKLINDGVVWNKLYKKDLITFKFDETLKLSEDYLFNLNYLKNAKNITHKKCGLYFYNLQNEQQVTKRLKHNLDIDKKIYNLADKCIKERFKNAVIQNWFNGTRLYSYVLCVLDSTKSFKDNKKSLKVLRESLDMQELISGYKGYKIREKLINGLFKMKLYLLIYWLRKIYY